MGTRHLVAVQIDGTYKIAQYGQWDGYPSGAGVKVLDFLKFADLEHFKKQLQKLSWISERELEERWAQAGAAPKANFVSLAVAEELRKRWPELSRDTGANVLAIVYNAEQPLKLKDSIDFAKDGLFCEWAYVIDLDANTFEVWKGFGKEPAAEGRFPGEVVDGYGPVFLRAKWSLDALPDEDEFLAATEGKSEEEEAA